MKQDVVTHFFELFGAAAFGRLCVETTNKRKLIMITESSRLRAAVC